METARTLFSLSFMTAEGKKAKTDVLTTDSTRPSDNKNIAKQAAV